MLKSKYKDQKNRKNDTEFFSAKASFVAGLVLWITIVKNIIELFITTPAWLDACYTVLILIMFAFIVGTRIFDNKLKTKNISNFGSFLTVCSIPYYVLDSLILKHKEMTSIGECITVAVFLGGIIIVGSIYLLIVKKK